MKLLTTNFLTCAIKTCKTTPLSFPLHFKDATLERTSIDYNPLFIRNILPRMNWDALKTTANELGLGGLVPEVNPVEFETEEEGVVAPVPREQIEEEDIEDENGGRGEEMEIETKEVDDSILKNLHTLLLETGVVEGKLCCGNCGFEYPIKDGVGNFLLPAHLV